MPARTSPSFGEVVCLIQQQVIKNEGMATDPNGRALPIKRVSDVKGPPRAGKGFHKLNTIDNLFAVYYGFQSGSLLVQGMSMLVISTRTPATIR